MPYFLCKNGKWFILLFANPNHWSLPRENTNDYGVVSRGGCLLYFYSITIVHLGIKIAPLTLTKCTLNEDHFPKTCLYSLTKINGTVLYGVLSKLKSRPCGHQITFLINSTFGKTLCTYIPPSSPIKHFYKLWQMPIFCITPRASKWYPLCPNIA